GFFTDGLVAELRKEFSDHIIVRELALVYQLTDGCGGEHLSHGAERELCCGRERDLFVAVSKAIRSSDDGLAVAGDDQYSRYKPGLGQFVRMRVDVAGHRGIAEVLGQRGF